jgi:hypothetical protein
VLFVLGLKGEMAAFELSLLRQRSLEALRQKARRGELQFFRFFLPLAFAGRRTERSKWIRIAGFKRAYRGDLQLDRHSQTERNRIEELLPWNFAGDSF